MPTISNAGATPIPPTTLLANELAAASALAPGLTANLPGSIIEDMASTSTGATVVIDQASTDLVNSIAPTSANAFILYQLGQSYGVEPGKGANTSVFVTFFSSAIGFPINPGFIVSDGTNQYSVQDGGVIQTSGQSAPLFCLSTTSGSFAVPTGTVTQTVTSLPSTITVTCSNLVSGVPGTTEQTQESYRAQVLQAGQVTAQGVPQFIKSQVRKVSGVQPNLVSVRPVGTSWEVICGGGDPYAVAAAILIGASNINDLVGSTILAATITNAFPAVVGTNLNHGYLTGQIVEFIGATGMTGINGVPFVAVVLSEKSFSLAVAISSITWSGSTVTVVTAHPHGLPSGATAGGVISGVTPLAYNGTYTFTKVDAVTFTYPLASNPGVETALGYASFDSVSSGTYTANSATITPNLRNITVSINDYPDVYEITYVNPPVQSAQIDLAWDTIASNFVSSTAVAQAGSVAIANYINAIAVGQPINIFDMQAAFLASIAGILDISLVSKMLFTVAINSVVTAPVANTGTIYGDPESYFNTSSAAIIIAQG